MIKVLHINSSVGTNSGVMNVIMNYYRKLDKSRIQFEFLYYVHKDLCQSTFLNEICKLGGKSYYIKKDLNLIANIKKFMKEHNGEFQIVHLHDVFLARFLYKTMKRYGVKKFIVHAHATNWSDSYFSGLRNKLLCKNIKKFTDEFFACSLLAGEFMFGKENSVFVLNNAIDVEKYKYRQHDRSELRSALNLEGKFVIGHVGRMAYQKNHVFLLKVFKKVKTLIENAVLLLVGDGPLYNNIVNEIQRLGLEKDVVFLGNRNDVDKIYQVMDIFVLPSIYEGLPVVGVEAQCSGLPVIMSNTITREVECHNCDYLDLVRNSKEDWAKSIVYCINVQNNRNMGVKYVSENGFNIDIEVKKLEDKYYSLIGE